MGAWKTTDNQDVYVFPSTVPQRACVVRQKNGQLEMKLAISMTADMRFDGNTGMFRVDPMTDVVAGRSDKSEPLVALYGAIGSPDVSASVKEELEQAKCVSELPRSVTINPIATKPDSKPMKKNPRLKIIPTMYKKGDFTARQWAAILIAADNWNKLISQDKDINGEFKIVFTAGTTKISGESWGKNTYAHAARIDFQVEKRSNYDDSEVDLDGVNYHNRVHFNSAWVNGKKEIFLVPNACLFGMEINGGSTMKNMISISMHEIGHTLGLIHPDEDTSLDAKGQDKENKVSIMGHLGCFNSGENSITENLIGKLESQGYKIDRGAIKNLVWDPGEVSAF